MAPWVHIHTHPTGETYLCCYSRGIAELGNTKSNSLEEIWNSDRMKQTRVNMLNDVPSDECSKCYEKENAGFNNSMRTHFNKYFGKYIPLTNQTKPDGTFNDFKIRYFDIRFSNLCNFRCRICSPNFSSNWYGDYKKLNIPVEHSQVIYPGKTEDDMLQQIGPHIEHLDQIYFAGGFFN
jgi:radical SAM protein with 4Fe4S-binding SPASM domain